MARKRFALSVLLFLGAIAVTSRVNAQSVSGVIGCAVLDVVEQRGLVSTPVLEATHFLDHSNPDNLGAHSCSNAATGASSVFPVSFLPLPPGPDWGGALEQDRVKILGRAAVALHKTGYPNQAGYSE